MADTLVRYEVSGPVAHVTLNRPEKLNALSYALVDELRDAVQRASGDDAVKVFVMKGAGRAFSAGYDLSEEVADQIEDSHTWHQVLSKDVDVTLELLRIRSRRSLRSTGGAWRAAVISSWLAT